MKIQNTESGWKEISTKHIKVTQFSPKPFMNVDKWIETNIKVFKRMPHKRERCHKCRTKWKDISQDSTVNLVFTNNGNKIICQHCYNELVSNNKKLQMDCAPLATEL